MNKLLYTSPFGPILLISQEGCLIYCNWVSEDCKSKRYAIEKLYDEETESEKDMETINKTITQLNEYFSCLRKEFDLPIKLIGTDFQKRVWRLLASVAYGSMISYKELSLRFGNHNAIRAVAQACGANPIAIILPCHRIVASNGNLGGYTGGLDKKIALLSLEQQKIKSYLLQ